IFGYSSHRVGSFLGGLSNPEDTLLFYVLGILQIMVHRLLYVIRQPLNDANKADIPPLFTRQPLNDANKADIPPLFTRQLLNKKAADDTLSPEP
ncbi:hypothetical protein, partial [Paenibacillus sp. MMS18-CY102]|uniref:hypothetical protein n=1 Tax=Paenibacillus sp. MMS18-CY102 TaxID=2682849 RepID=UPI001F3427CB